MKNFEVGKDIKTLLSLSPEVSSALGNKIFPLIATAKTTFPFLVYRRSYYTPMSTKDWENEKVGVEIVIAATQYDESVKIADAVSEALLHKTTQNIDDIEAITMSEDFIEDTYLQRITMEITLK